jgi:hypothetical protein
MTKEIKYQLGEISNNNLRTSNSYIVHINNDNLECVGKKDQIIIPFDQILKIKSGTERSSGFTVRPLNKRDPMIWLNLNNGQSYGIFLLGYRNSDEKLDSLKQRIKTALKDWKENQSMYKEKKIKAQGQELEVQTLEKIKKIVKVSDRVSIELMRSTLKLDVDTFNEKLFDWAAEFDFRIDGEYIVINKNTLTDFIDALDTQFEEWADHEKGKTGKID